MKRQDIHRRSALVPQDYAHVLVFALPGSFEGMPDPGFNLDTLAKMQRELPFFRQGRGSCNVCGARFREGSVFVHVPTGEHIIVGHECAEQIEGHSMAEQHRRTGLAALERARKRAALRKLIKDLAPETRKALRLKHHIIQDIRRKAIQYGDLSCKQVDLVLKIAREDAERAARPEEKHVPAPVVEGKRVAVEGVVVSIKTHDGFRGPVEKITVKVQTEAGSWLAWGTAPSSLLDQGAQIGGIKGCRVWFCAVLKAGREPHFALFSRPTKGVIMKGGPAQQKRLEELRADLAHHEVLKAELAERVAGIAQAMDVTLDPTEPSAWETQTRDTIAKLEELLK